MERAFRFANVKYNSTIAEKQQIVTPSLAGEGESTPL
jgi:hypothetical protein